MKTRLLFFSAILLSFSINAQIDFQAHIIAESNPDLIGVYKVISVDLDGDGDKDVVATSTEGNKIVWFENLDGQGTFSELKIVATIPKPIYLFAGDLDGDGDQDLLVASESGKVVWYKNLDGQGNFGPEQIISNHDYASVVYAVDIDNDGDLDVFTSAGSENTKIFWQENLDGQGTFGPMNILMEGNFVCGTLFPTDIDNDGDQDLIVGFYGATDTVVWLENLDGQGTFGPAQIISNELLVPDSVFAADVDNDGDQDVLVASYGIDKVIWYENTDGQGTFGNEHLITSSADGATNIFARDLNNDGYIDVVCAAATGNEIIYYLNDGSGNFNYQQTIASNFTTASCVIADDFNGDGKIDILASAYSGNKIIWFENKGPLGIEENTTNLFSIYPNPANGLLNIKSSTSIAEITVYNNLGQLLITSEEKNQVDVSVLGEGIYFVKIKDENGQIETKKIIKK